MDALVMPFQADHVDLSGLRHIVPYLEDHAVMYVDPAGILPVEVEDEFLAGFVQRFGLHPLEHLHDLPALFGGELVEILAGLFGEHHDTSFRHLRQSSASECVRSASSTESRMVGSERR